ncbi:hypothetical protein D3C81_09400 [compost metagenome]
MNGIDENNIDNRVDNKPKFMSYKTLVDTFMYIAMLIYSFLISITTSGIDLAIGEEGSLIKPLLIGVTYTISRDLLFLGVFGIILLFVSKMWDFKMKTFNMFYVVICRCLFVVGLMYMFLK